MVKEVKRMEAAFSSLINLSVTKTLKQHWTQESFSYLKNPRPDHGLMLLTSGHIDFVSESHTLHAHAGDVVYLPCGCRYKAVFLLSRGSIDNYLINFTASSLNGAPVLPTVLRHGLPAEHAEHFRRIVHHHRLQPLSPVRQQGELLLLLDEIIRPQQEPYSAVLEQACALLQETDLSVCAISRRCSVSESSLRALFHLHLNLSPLQFRQKTRLARAAYLLESTDRSIGEIAGDTHFYDTASFCRSFKKHYGQTPREYARSKKL